jgi:transcriptional regulator with XRE-family HTH domain
MGDVGQEIRRLREAKGWSQPKLAVEAGVAVSGVSQIENGRRNPNSSTLVKLARALDVDVADFFPKVEAPLWSDNSSAERRDADVTQRFDDVLEVTGYLDEYLYGAGMQRVCIERLEDGSVELRGYRT